MEKMWQALNLELQKNYMDKDHQFVDWKYNWKIKARTQDVWEENSLEARDSWVSKIKLYNWNIRNTQTIKNQNHAKIVYYIKTVNQNDVACVTGDLRHFLYENPGEIQHHEIEWPEILIVKHKTYEFTTLVIFLLGGNPEIWRLPLVVEYNIIFALAIHNFK